MVGCVDVGRVDIDCGGVGPCWQQREESVMVSRKLQLLVSVISIGACLAMAAVVSGRLADG